MKGRKGVSWCTRLQVCGSRIHTPQQRRVRFISKKINSGARKKRRRRGGGEGGGEEGGGEAVEEEG